MKKNFYAFILKALFITKSIWRNRLARSADNRKVGVSNLPRDDLFLDLIKELKKYDLYF